MGKVKMEQHKICAKVLPLPEKEHTLASLSAETKMCSLSMHP